MKQQIEAKLEAFLHWALFSEGSSRSSALIRIGLALMLWTHFADQMVLSETTTWPEAILALNFFVATTAMLVGLFSQLASLWSALVLFTMYYYFGLGQGYDWVYHHIYLLCMATLFCAFTPCGKSYAVDRWWAIRQAERKGQPIPAERGNIWGLRLMAIQVAVLYFTTAYDKMIPSFINGERMQSVMMSYYTGSDYPTVPLFEVAMVAIAWGTILLEFALAFGLFMPRFRTPLVILGIVFHAGIFVMVPVETFSATMWLLYMAYYDPQVIHRFIDKLQGYQPAPS